MDLQSEINRIQKNRENANKIWHEAKKYEVLFWEGKYEEIENDEEFLFQLKNWINQNELLIPSHFNPKFSMFSQNIKFLDFVKDLTERETISEEEKESMVLVEKTIMSELEKRIIEHERRRELVKQRIIKMREKEQNKNALNIASSLLSVIPELGSLLTAIGLIRDFISLNKNKMVHKNIEDMIL